MRATRPCPVSSVEQRPETAHAQRQTRAGGGSSGALGLHRLQRRHPAMAAAASLAAPPSGQPQSMPRHPSHPPVSQCASVPSPSPSSTEPPQEPRATARKSAGGCRGHGAGQGRGGVGWSEVGWDALSGQEGSTLHAARAAQRGTHLRPPAPATRGGGGACRRCGAPGCPARPPARLPAKRPGAPLGAPPAPPAPPRRHTCQTVQHKRGSAGSMHGALAACQRYQRTGRGALQQCKGRTAHPPAARSAARGEAAQGAWAAEAGPAGPSHSTAVNCRSTWRTRAGGAPPPTHQISEGAPLRAFRVCVSTSCS